MFRALFLSLTISPLLLTGCGTFADAISGPSDDHCFYRGVRMDVSAIQEGGRGRVLIADLPFSAIADTLMVPYIASLYLAYELAPSDASESDHPCDKVYLKRQPAPLCPGIPNE